MRLSSIAARLSLAFALVALGVFGVLGYYLSHFVDSHFAQQDYDELRGKLALAANILDKSGGAAPVAQARGELTNALVGHPGLMLAIFDAQGTLLFATPDPRLPAAVADAAQRHRSAQQVVVQTGEGHERYRVAMARYQPQAGALQLVVARGVAHHGEFLADFRGTLWLSVLTAALITAVLGALIARRQLKPARKIARAAQAVTAQRLGERISTERVPDELTQLVHAFNDMLARLDDAFQRLSAFSADIAHELRTPINNLRGQTEVALSRARSADEYREVLASNLEEYDRLGRMIADMLLLAKADNGLLIPAAESVDLRALADRLVEYFLPLLEDSRIAIDVQGEAHTTGDRIMLERALGNLLSNAAKHTPPGGSIRVRLARGDGEVFVSIANTGMPLPDEYHEKIFDRFFRIDPARRELEGAGLGLAISRSIVQAHGGRIAVQSDAQETRFTCLFPASAAG